MSTIPPTKENWVLKLYLGSDSHESHLIATSVKGFCEQQLSSDYELTVVEVWNTPEVAEKDGIKSFPALVRLSPLPKRVITDKLSSPGVVLHALGL